MKDEVLVPVAALVFAAFALLTAWMATWDLWTEGMCGLLVICSVASMIGLIGCILVQLDEQNRKN